MYQKPKVFRIAGAIPVPVNEEVDKYAALAGISKNQFVGLLVQLGLNSWIRAYSPEKVLTAQDWARIMESVEVVKKEGIVNEDDKAS